jgi:dolichol-phosphate mannosyltransferase
MSLLSNLREMERTREAYWLRYPATSPWKLHWCAVAVRHCFHILPGEAILELGAGSGPWTEQLAEVLKSRNPITATVFNDDLSSSLKRKQLRDVRVVNVVDDLSTAFAPGTFDYIIGTAILCHNEYAQNLRALMTLLKPGGQILFFEANHWNPQVLIKNTVPAIGQWAGHARCQAPMRKYKLMKTASHAGFTNIEVIPFDIVHPRIPRKLIQALQSFSYIA